MSHVLWSQDIFTKGEISPLMYARISVAPYYNGLKTAKNVIAFPQGAAGKRFGTIYQNTIAGITSAQQIFFATMQYLNECVYQIAIIPNAVNIYLEGIFIAQITGTPIGANAIRLIDHTILDNIFRITTGVVAPQDIQRTSNAANIITTIDTVGNIITLTSAQSAAGLVLPVRFTAGTTLFSSTPQVLANKTYFLYMLSTTTAQIYNSSYEAAHQLNPFILTGGGTGTQTAFILNTWTMAQTVITNYPTYDFSGGVPYEAFTFTPSSVSGNAINIDCNNNIFTAAMVGGLFIGNSGVMRILSYASPTTISGATIVSFADTSGILGINAALTEPAWSNTRGWPRVCSSFQNRAFFANTDLLPNGLWGSVINDYNSFDDSQLLATNAISWYPTSDDINYIRFIVPYRSLTIHTNSGVFSTPLSVETAITPANFSLTLQDSTPAESVQPRGIDNQIVILSGNDAHSLLWDGFNNAYQANIISIANEQLIRDPVDEAAFVDLTRAGSRYMLIVNMDGTLAIYQTLISEDVQGFTPGYLEQSYGNAYFRWVATSFDGRGWFITERQIATASAPVAITGYTATTLQATASGFSTTQPTGIQFATTSVLPTSLPQIQVNEWYWAIGTDANDFMVYLTQFDALNNLNPVTFSNFGNNSTVIPWPLVTNFMLEELSFEAKVDCCFNYTGTATSSFANLPNFNNQFVKINGSGYGFDYVGINSTVQTIAHGITTTVTQAQIGFPINVEIEPLPISIYANTTKQSNLQTPKHIRTVSFMFADTIGGTVNGQPIAMLPFSEVNIGTPPLPVNGIFEIGLFQGWDDFQNIGIQIMHSEPFDFKLIGIFYKVDV